MPDSFFHAGEADISAAEDLVVAMDDFVEASQRLVPSVDQRDYKQSI